MLEGDQRCRARHRTERHLNHPFYRLSHTLKCLSISVVPVIPRQYTHAMGEILRRRFHSHHLLRRVRTPATATTTTGLTPAPILPRRTRPLQQATASKERSILGSRVILDSHVVQDSRVALNSRLALDSRACHHVTVPKIWGLVRSGAIPHHHVVGSFTKRVTATVKAFH